MIERKSGADFDREYMQHMVKDHEKDLADVKNIAAKVKDAEFKAALQQATGKIQEHLQLAQRIAQGAAAGGTSSTPAAPSTPPTPSAPATSSTPSTPPSGAEINPKINFSK